MRIGRKRSGAAISGRYSMRVDNNNGKRIGCFRDEADETRKSVNTIEFSKADIFRLREK